MMKTVLQGARFGVSLEVCNARLAYNMFSQCVQQATDEAEDVCIEEYIEIYQFLWFILGKF